jgi:hypothetical protein
MRIRSRPNLRSDAGSLPMGDYDWHIFEEDLEDGDERVRDGDVLGDVTNRRRQRAQSKAGEIPYEREWETDLSTFRAGTVCDF